MSVHSRNQRGIYLEGDDLIFSSRPSTHHTFFDTMAYAGLEKEELEKVRAAAGCGWQGSFAAALGSLHVRPNCVTDRGSTAPFRQCWKFSRKLRHLKLN